MHFRYALGIRWPEKRSLFPVNAPSTNRKVQFLSRGFGNSMIAMSSCDCVYPIRRKAVLVAAALIPMILLSFAANQVENPTRIGGDIKMCSESDLVVNQGPSDPLPSGIPTYTVEIINACATGCDITRIHFNCGWFSSARLIDPSLFKRVGYDDCVVNEGKSLLNGQIISFQYANTFSYPLSVSKMKCLANGIV
ncbi:hypothetical protein V2J09_011892 [Rumex salicifolius]